MPWYTNPATTCKVLNRIANRCQSMAREEISSVLDNVTALIWKKQEHYTGKQPKTGGNVSGRPEIGLNR